MDRNPKFDQAGASAGCIKLPLRLRVIGFRRVSLPSLEDEQAELVARVSRGAFGKNNNVSQLPHRLCYHAKKGRSADLFRTAMFKRCEG